MSSVSRDDSQSDFTLAARRGGGGDEPVMQPRDWEWIYITSAALPAENS